MGPKKKGDGKKKGKEKKHVAPSPKKSEYLAKIAEMNGILAEARKAAFLIESTYINTEKRYEQVQNDMDDVMEYLQYETNVNEEEIASYNSEIAAHTKEMQKQKKYYDAIFNQMDEEYELKSRELTEKIQSIKAKLNSFEEVRGLREDFLVRQEELKKLIEEMTIRHNEEIYECEKQAIIEQDRFQKDMENRLEELAVDFREATDVRIGETTNRIIVENIKLGNILTCQQELITKMRNNYTEMKKIHKHAAMNLELKQDEYNLVFERYTENSLKITELLQLAEDLTKKIEDLKKLIKINRTLRRKIAEMECLQKEATEEYNIIEKSLEDMEEVTASAKRNLHHYEKNILKLQIILFEAAKKVKEAIECEYLALPVIEQIAHVDETTSQTDLDELEEEKERIYMKRESLIVEILVTLQSSIFSSDDIYLTASPTESYDINSYLTATTEYTPTTKRSIERGDIEQN